VVCLSSPDPTRLILTFGAKVNARDKVNGNTALHWACTSGNHAVTKLLLDAGADMSLMNARVSVYINYIAHIVGTLKTTKIVSIMTILTLMKVILFDK